MALKRKVIPRKFIFDGIVLADPNPDMSPEDVMDFYSSTYPALNNAVVIGPVTKESEVEYEFQKVVGTKG